MAPIKPILSSATKAVDPTLDALFASSIGPAESRAKPKYESLLSAKKRAAPTPKPVAPLSKEEKEAEGEDSDEETEDSDASEEDSEDDGEYEEEQAAAAPADLNNGAGKRKRKSREDDDNLEGRYFDKLERETEGPVEKRVKSSAASDDEEGGTSSESEGGDDVEDSEDNDEPIVHESLLNAADDAAPNDGDSKDDVDKAARTVFLSNVSIQAVTGKAAKKTLLAHLASVGTETQKSGKKSKKGDKSKDKPTDKNGTEETPEEGAKKNEASIVESLRFRSVPFASAAVPKRAAYITKAVMGATAQSTNAYAVYATAAAARLAVLKLNGTVVLDRHLRADSVAHPSPVDHRRCVFVGNLGFVDDETILSAAAAPEDDGEGGGGNEEPGVSRKKRHKMPMDIEEGLWRTFGKHAGKVESVRVIRDQATRVGKGIAYVQFYDANSVEAALLLADKRFPPLLPRPLRVSRCKAPHKTARALERSQLKAKATSDKEARRDRGTATAGKTTGYRPKLTAEQQTSAGRAAKLLGRSSATVTAQSGGGGDTPIVFEGMRARVGSSRNLFKKGKGNKKGGAPASKNQARRTDRAAKWRGKQGS